MLSRSIFRTSCVTIGLAAAIVFAAGDARGQQPITVGEVDREFDLNIVEDRIVEAEFFRSTAISADGRNLRVNVGAMVSGQNTVITLRGITGHVTFRATLGPLRSRIERILK